MSIEVGEHIPRALEANYMHGVVSSAGDAAEGILLSWCAARMQPHSSRRQPRGVGFSYGVRLWPHGKRGSTQPSVTSAIWLLCSSASLLICHCHTVTLT